MPSWTSSGHSRLPGVPGSAPTRSTVLWTPCCPLKLTSHQLSCPQGSVFTQDTRLKPCTSYLSQELKE